VSKWADFAAFKDRFREIALQRRDGNSDLAGARDQNLLHQHQAAPSRKPVIAEFLNSVCSRAKLTFAARESTLACRRITSLHGQISFDLLHWKKHARGLAFTVLIA